VSTVEWFDALPSVSLGTLDLKPSSQPSPVAYLFAPIEAGAVLAVIVTPGLGMSVAEVLRPCGLSGCPSPSVDGPQSLKAVSLAAEAALVPAAAGSPVLWTGSEWLRWAPWSGEFQSIWQGPPGPQVLTPFAPDPGLALWVAKNDAGQGAVEGLRFDTRGPYAPDGPVTALNSAADRFAPLDVSWNGSFLSIGNGAKVFVTDATFANITIELDNVQLLSPSSLPGIILRDDLGNETEVGGTQGCAWQVPAGNTSFQQLRVVRQGASLQYQVDSGVSMSCTPPGGILLSPTARVSVGMEGPAALDGAEIASWSVTRAP
jgi:hypothetical protein